MATTGTMAAAAALAVTALASGAARADFTDGRIVIGILNDMSGVYADSGGRGSVVAAQMAVDDMGGSVNGTPVTVVGADHQNKADIGANIARKWYDTEGVDTVVDVPNSAVALAVNEVTREKNKVFIDSGAATSELTGSKCSPNTVHWTFDTWALAHGTGKAMVDAGGSTWFFVTADYAFGQDLEKQTTAVVLANGGKVLGSVRAPLSTPDFSSFLLQAQASGAKVIGLANAGNDASNSIKQAAEFGITQGGQKLAGLLLYPTDMHALGLQTAQGLVFTSAFWEHDDASRAFAARYAKAYNGSYPTMLHAGVYGGVLHYLKALKALGSDGDGKAVVAKMKEIPTDDAAFGEGVVRVDGRHVHPMYLVEAKKPEESTGPWDLLKLRATIPADQAFRPLAEGNCPLVKG